jgi:hypothetical protein
VTGSVSTVAILTAASASVGSALGVADCASVGGATCTIGRVFGLSLQSWHSTSVGVEIGLLIIGIGFASGMN